METQELEHTGNSVKETNNFDYSKNEETTHRESISGTPFNRVWNKGEGYRLCIAEYAVTEPMDTIEETEEIINKHDWGMLTNVIGAIMEVQRKVTEIENLTKEMEAKNGNN